LRPDELGINLVGYENRIMGLSESKMLYSKALKLLNLPVNSIGASSSSSPFLSPPSKESGLNTFSHSVNLIVVNPDQMPSLDYQFSKNWRQNKRNICIWAWELQKYDASLLKGLDYVDDIWVVSQFVKSCFEQYVDKEISVINIPQSLLDEELEIRLFNFDYFYFSFDFLSDIERKNPYQLIELFNSLVFDFSLDIHLVIKTVNAKLRLDKYNDLVHKSKSNPFIHIIDATWTEPVVNSVIKFSLGVISLHRSEGFGLLLSKSMALGKLTVATSFGGNLDFMDTSNSLLIDHKLVPVSNSVESIYRLDAYWAEPDLEDVINKITSILNNNSLRKNLENRAKINIETKLSPTKIANDIYKKLF
jgi:glycosyltransferase involved in cell wall biosynthesis